MYQRQTHAQRVYRSTRAMFSLSLFGAVYLSAADSDARSGRVSQLPNFSSIGCTGCHDDYPPSGNSFGLDAWRTFSPTLQESSGGRVNWSLLYNLDSDGDGFTNGEELGDPYGVWTPGASPRFNTYSNPSDTYLYLSRVSCGNGVIDQGEDCDGTNLNGNTCESFGFFGGEVSCRPTCFLELGECVRDSDADGAPDDVDNCVDVPNPDQANLDRDRQGDACDPDLDGDQINNEQDNCPQAPNYDQADLDGDLLGDSCDSDADSDGILAETEEQYGTSDLSLDSDSDGVSDQEEYTLDGVFAVDTDGDGSIDAADSDSDNDGVLDGFDNCRYDPNPDQNDGDANGRGDACDPLSMGGSQVPSGGMPIAGEPVGGEGPLSGEEPSGGEPTEGPAAGGGEPAAGEPAAGEPAAGEPAAGAPVYQPISISEEEGCQQRGAPTTLPELGLLLAVIIVLRRSAQAA